MSAGYSDNTEILLGGILFVLPAWAGQERSSNTVRPRARAGPTMHLRDILVLLMKTSTQE
jgi:hypothetical protein